MASAAEQLAANLNFSALAKAEELKKRIWFTVGALLVYRLGTYIPLPGIDPNIWEQVFRTQAGGILGMFNMFSGGGIHRMAIFALNIMPYISASIIIQLMTTVSPTLEQLKKEGESGRKMMNQYTRYLTVLLAAFQSYGIAVGLEGSGNVVADPGLPRAVVRVALPPGAVATELPNTITEPDIAERMRKVYSIAIPADSFANMVVFAMSQPEDVDVNEILYRPTKQEY